MPYAKTGGLADVAGALVRELGRSATTFAPSCRCTPPYGATIPSCNPVPGLQQVSHCGSATRIRYSLHARDFPGTRYPGVLHRLSGHVRSARLSTPSIRMNIGASCCSPAPPSKAAGAWSSRRIYFIATTGTRHSCRCFLKTHLCLGCRCSRVRESVLTIHNIGYQGIMPAAAVADLGLGRPEVRLDAEDLARGVINPLKTGINFADRVTTVSPTYAREICETPLGMGMQDALRKRRDGVIGILNGVDYREWDPRHDPHLDRAFRAGRICAASSPTRRLLTSMQLEPAAARSRWSAW